MSTTFIKKVTILTFTATILACNNNPKVIEASNENADSATKENIFKVDPNIQVGLTSNNPFAEELHQVLVKEVMPAERYVYLKIEEQGKPAWIATRKMDVTVGETYFYKGGLLKTNFESKEYNRMFDTIYLVSNLVSSDHSKHINPLDQTAKAPIKVAAIKKEDIPTHIDKNVAHKGKITVAELVKSPKKFEGNTVELTGTCVKINPSIMNRNWIHIQDGSKNDYDLVITSDTYIPEGTNFTIKALVSLNRDFGAGYSYDLILEDGVLVQ